MLLSRVAALAVILAAVGACVRPVLPPGIELQSDFGAADWVRSFEPKTRLPWRQGAARTRVVDDAERARKVLEIAYPKGGVGPAAEPQSAAVPMIV